jgi:hypothetical protein
MIFPATKEESVKKCILVIKQLIHEYSGGQ